MSIVTTLRGHWRATDFRWRFTARLAATLLLLGVAAGLVVGPLAVRMLQSDWARPLFVWAPFPKVPKLVMLAGYGGLLGVGLVCIAVAIALAGAAPSTLDKLLAAGARVRGLRWRPRTAALVLVLCALPLLWATFVRPFRVPNEFPTLPGQTIGKDGKVRDNLAYIRDHGLEGLTVPAADGRPLPPLRIAVRSPAALRSARALAAATPEYYWVDPDAVQLEIHQIPDAFAYQALLAIGTPADLPRLQQKFADDMRAALAFSTRQYSAEEKDFLNRNRLELERGLVLGRFFYHHNFIFQAAVAAAADPSTVAGSQYGKGLTQGFAAVLHVVPEDLRFNAYLLALYASYPLYLALLVAVGRGVGLRGWRLVAVAAAGVLSYLMSDIETVRLGVGLAPWRHLLDVAVLYALYRLICLPGIARMLLLVVLSVAGIYWSREMGLFIAVAAAGGLFAAAMIRASRSAAVYGAVLLALSVVAWPLSDPHAQMMVSAVLLGVNTPGLPFGSLFVEATAAVASVMFGIWLWLAGRLDEGERRHRWLPEWVLLAATILYAAASGIYLMYYPRPHHLAPYFPAMALGTAAGWPLLMQACRGRTAVWVARAGTAMVGVMLAACVLLALVQARDVAREERNFLSHVTHAWNFPAARLTSTGEPALLQQAVGMIRARESRATVDILSPWEAVLLPLAGKGKSGPFVLSFDSLVTEAEVLRLREHLLHEGSGVLFVDTRLMQGDYETPLQNQAYLFERVYASVLRLRAHAMLRDVFTGIAPCYRLVEKGALISTYMRVSATCR